MNATCPCEQRANTYELNATNGTLTINGTDLELTHNECQLMRLLNTTPGAYYPAEQIVEQGLQMPGATTRRVKDIVRRLRAKLTTAGHRELLQNTRGRGYRINPSNPRTR